MNRLGSDVVAELGQRRVDSIGCPHCASRDVVHWGKASALPRYRCKGCQRTFNALTNTPLAGLRMKDKWPAQAEAMIEGVSIAKAAKRCDVDDTTAFRWRHRFLASWLAISPACCRASSKAMKPSLWNRSKASDPACRARPAREVANRPSAGCPPNRSLFWWHGTVRVRPRMRCCQS